MILALLFAFQAAAAAAPAQAPAKPKPNPVPAYTAEKVATSSSTAPNGQTNESRSTILVARDAQGRTRQEFDPANDTPPRPGAQHRITISDPVAKVNYTILPEQHSVTELAWQQGIPSPKVAPTPAPAPPTPASLNSPLGVRITTEALGTRTIQGLTATGSRITRDFPATPNQPEATQSTETWHSAVLGVDLLVINHNSSAHADSTTELDNIHLGDPPASLFAIPTEYAVTKIKPPPPGGNPIANDLFRQAKAGLTNVPDLAAPDYLVFIARSEMIGRNLAADSPGIEDLETAFHKAAALPSMDSNPNDAATMTSLKGSVEMQVVNMLVAGHQDEALALTRQSDLTGIYRANMYERIIVGSAVRSRTANAPTLDLLALVQECQQASGLFPFNAVANVLQSAALAPGTRVALLRAGYAAAADSAAAPGANPVPLLTVGHRLEPGLDAELESTLLAILQQPAPAASSGPGLSSVYQQQWSNRSNGALLALLRQIDPDRAQEMATQMPAAAADAPTQIKPGAGPFNQQMQQILTDPNGALANAAQIADTAARIQKLIQIANLLAGNVRLQTTPSGVVSHTADPALAGQAALAALSLVNDDLLDTRLGMCFNLAMTLDRLQLTSQAADLLARCLDAADAQAAQADARPTDGDDVEWAQNLRSLQQFANDYQIAARIVPDATLAHAQANEDPLFQPLALAAVAGVLAVAVTRQP